MSKVLDNRRGGWLYKEFRCSECKKTFLRGPEWAYKNTRINEVYCSYSCMRVKQKVEEAKFRKQYLADVKRYRPDRESSKNADLKEHRIALCNEKIAYYWEQIARTAPGSDERDYASRGLRAWKAKLAKAQS